MASKIAVGPPGGPNESTIPDEFTIWITEEPPYDLRLDVTWDRTLGHHTLHELTLTEQAGGEYVRMSRINQLALADIVERALTEDVIGPTDGPRFVAEHPQTTQWRSTPSSTGSPTRSPVRSPPPPSPSPVASPYPPDRSEPVHARQAGLISPAGNPARPQADDNRSSLISGCLAADAGDNDPCSGTPATAPRLRWSARSSTCAGSSAWVRLRLAAGSTCRPRPCMRFWSGVGSTASPTSIEPRVNRSADMSTSGRAI